MGNALSLSLIHIWDGGKYNYSKAEQQRLREASDRLCREYGLSVIEKPRKAPSRPVWLDEKNGKPTRYNVYRADVQEAIDFSRTPYYMEDYLRRKGYITCLLYTSMGAFYDIDTIRIPLHGMSLSQHYQSGCGTLCSTGYSISIRT